jgi:hypothetical protein
MEHLNKVEFDQLKQRLARALNSLEGALRVCPDFERYSVRLEDGHELVADEIIEWLASARQNCWQAGPPEVRRRKLHEVIREQPHG